MSVGITKAVASSLLGTECRIAYVSRLLYFDEYSLGPPFPKQQTVGLKFGHVINTTFSHSRTTRKEHVNGISRCMVGTLAFNSVGSWFESWPWNSIS
jgi:hypothetical protein